MLKVPLFKQKYNNSCGITALRMVLSFYGMNVSENKIIKGVGGLKKYGIRAIRLAEFARSLGFKTKTFSVNKKLADSLTQIKNPDIRYVLKYLGREIPVILNVRYSLLYNKKPTKEGHFIVVSGHKKNYFWYNDPENAKVRKVEANHLKLAWIKNAFDSSAYLLIVYRNE